MRHWTRSLLVSSLTVAVLSLVPASAALGHATSGIPYHAADWAWCDGGGAIRVYPPRQALAWYGRWETVTWRPYLYRWNGTTWVYYRAQPRLQAAANARGIHPVNGYYWYLWTGGAGGRPYTFLRYTSLPPGTYSLRHFIRWESTSVSHGSALRFNQTTSTTCRL